MGDLYSEKYKSMIISDSVVLRIRNVSNTVECIVKHIICCLNSSKNRAIYEIMWKRTAQSGRTQLKIWHIQYGTWNMYAVKRKLQTHTQNM
jgi:hypothetical protein